MMKRVTIIAVCLLAFQTLWSQQDPMYSQYMFNMLTLNPAYAGSQDALSVTLLYRAQWVGIDNAPQTQSFSVHTPTNNKKSAFGINLVNDKLSYIGQTWINLSYAYRIKFDKGALAFGLQGTVYNYRIDWSQASLINPNDPVPGNYGNNLILPNAGFGVYYNSDRFYFGVSVPRLLVNSLDDNNPGVSFEDNVSDIALLKRHYFASAGVVIPLSRDVMFKPSALLKYVYGAPMQVDANANFYFNEKFGFGLSYRTGDGMVAMVEYMFTPQLRMGYAYDYPFTLLRGYTSGSHEIMLGYDFHFKRDEVVSPRVF